MSEHKPGCATVIHEEVERTLQLAYHEDVTDYKIKWPAHCDRCRGWGLAAVDGSYGTLEQDVGHCLSCIGNEVCPRCRSAVEWIDGVGGYCCEGCCFVEGKTEGLPNAPDLVICDCWSLEDATS